MGEMNRRKTGSRYEQKAVDYLERRGLTILERNYRCRSGEIDVIAEDERYLVFVEVKYRRDTKKGDPAASETRQSIICTATKTEHMFRAGSMW